MPKLNDPKPEILRIEELVRRVKSGDIKLPKFQRPFVWDQDDILELLDSVYNGYPIGSVLLWRTKHRLESQRTLGDLKVEERPEEYPTNYLLDGQQRISTLCGVLFWDGENKKSRWNVAFDLKAEKFFCPDPTEELKPHHFPLRRLLDLSDFLGQIQALEGYEDRQKLISVAQRLLQAVKDYQLAAVILGDMGLDEVAPIFERINSRGHRLTIVDLMRAATWKGNFDLSDAIDGIQEDLEPKRFAEVPEKSVLRNMAAALDLGIENEDMDKLRYCSTGQLKQLTEITSRAYKLAVDFLHSDLNVWSHAYLPYGLQLTFLVEFFRKCPAPNLAQRKALRRWFWRTSLCAYYQGANSTAIAQDLKAIRALAQNESADIPIQTMFEISKFMEVPFSLRSARSKTFALILAAGKPRNLLDGAPIDVHKALSVANSLEFHHVFPRKHLKEQGWDNTFINRPANICMLNLDSNRTISSTSPGKYLSDIANGLASDFDEVLRSNYISQPAWQAALNGDYQAFLQNRAAELTVAAALLSETDDFS